MWDVFPGRYSNEAPDDEHMEVLVTALSENGAAYLNAWRTAHPSVQPNLARIEFAVGKSPSRSPVGVNLSGYDLSGAIVNLCSLAFANLSETKLAEAKLRETLINQSTIFKSDFLGAALTQASMSALKCIATRFSGAELSRVLLHASTVFACNFDQANLEDAVLHGALLNGSSFRKARLRSTKCGASDLSGCVLAGADLSGAHFIKTRLGGADLTGARVYGVNCWWKTVQVDLNVVTNWRRFESDGNPGGPPQARFDCICSVILKVGRPGTNRPDRGKEILERFSLERTVPDTDKQPISWILSLKSVRQIENRSRKRAFGVVK